MSSPVKILSSSLRTRSAEESLEIAEPLAKSRGVTRVVNTTWMDKIGIPVYASIRPRGGTGSLSVHAGKGFTHAEAKIGAFMEAIEYSFAVPGCNHTQWHLANPADILQSFRYQIDFPQFCARLGHTVEADDQLAVVTGDEIKSGLGPVLVPAELVYFPYHDMPGKRLYGATTNGLASGNTLDEATAHGLAEVMERHVASFNTVKEHSVLVTTDNAPYKVKQLIAQIEAVGLSCFLRYNHNVFGMAYFSAYVCEPDEYSPIGVAFGAGFHPIREIAAVRAIAEAVQSRLSHIHGGRDDIIHRVQFVEKEGKPREHSMMKALREQVADEARACPYEDIPDFSSQISSIEDALRIMYEGLSLADMHHVVRVTLTEETYPFQIVRVIVPGAEMFEPELQRVGPRLLSFYTSLNSSSPAALNL